MKIIQPPRKRGKSQSRAKDQIEVVESDSFKAIDSMAFSAKPQQAGNTRHQNAGPRSLTARRAKTSRTHERELRPVSTDHKQDLRTRIYHKAIQLLARREHNISELRCKLLANKVLHGESSVDETASEMVEKVLRQLVSENYLSDERFTEAYVRARSLRGIGPIKLRAELTNKGVDAALIEKFIDMDGFQWRQSAEQQYYKKYGDKPVSDYNEWSKRARFLQSRGFTMEHIKAAVPNLSFE